MEDDWDNIDWDEKVDEIVKAKKAEDDVKLKAEEKLKAKEVLRQKQESFSGRAVKFH
jgi:anaerobic selenocysteine-containing dehydrogenase